MFQMRKYGVLMLGLACTSLVIASEADALAISSNIQARHLPYGTILDPVFANAQSNQIVSYTRCGDSAIWTGHYLAAEAFRYKVTRSMDALANVRNAVAGLKSLVDVTGTDLLARCLVPLSSPYAQSIIQEEQHNGIYTNSAASEYWVGHTSRDQYCGAFFGLSAAFDLVDDPAVRSSIAILVTRMLDFLVAHAWIVVMPDGTPSTTFIGRADQELSLLEVGREVNPAKYSGVYLSNKLLLAFAVLLPITLEVQSNSSYFKFNLDYINLYDLIRLEDSSSYLVYEPAYRILRENTENHQNAFFNMIDCALHGPDATRDTQTVAYLDAWLERPRRDVFVDLRGKVPSCGSPAEACSPVPISMRPTTDFLWQRDPFLLDGGGAGTIEGPGIDYILPYWMARFYGVQAGGAIVEAASGGAAVSPQSIASFYGSNLTAGTASATSLPLPTTLAGVSIQVTDAAGALHLAPLIYASPTQINFEIPAGTALGRASFKVVNNSNAGVPAATADVQNVAPGLFTADASGKGVAAALAVRQILNSPSKAYPIFRCANGTCVSVPIDLGVDTPTALSLFGTGIRNRTSLSSVAVTINGIHVPVQYAGSQSQFPGLDQVNVGLPLNLRGSGETDLVLTVDGQAANTVRVNIQ
jgi:uncharacterized protein (TIGR03437 family)